MNPSLFSVEKISSYLRHYALRLSDKKKLRLISDRDLAFIFITGFMDYLYSYLNKKK